MFASSLMSRWLLQYSPFAVLLRLLSLSILLSFLCLQIFRLSHATQPSLHLLSRSLLCWICVSVVLMMVYFATQQDIDITMRGTDGYRDDRRRRTVLRLKCLYVVSGCSLFSLLVVLGILHLDSLSTFEWKDLRSSLGELGAELWGQGKNFAWNTGREL
jgi:ABC-type Fe3+ transport system permease subunit